MSFMSSLKSAAASAVTGGDDDKKNTGSDQSSNSDLMASAKLVAEAAQNATSNQSDKIDKPKVAGAAADLLDAAKTYGKFDETQGVGQYLKKADDYLHEYEKSESSNVTYANTEPQHHCCGCSSVIESIHQDMEHCCKITYQN
ncbi:protein involved in response to salt stress [Artemisia annua]|uniref:Protein involved in response to salt stress n=1 Tax=Artemisia annua TaxID=35608 RepID=A0A2U1M5M8_ARTAN|nr:protein involved in response to salt stress [Artemisia annua]